MVATKRMTNSEMLAGIDHLITYRRDKSKRNTIYFTLSEYAGIKGYFIGVKYTSTIVCIIQITQGYPNRKYTVYLDSGGYRTKSTKDRINQTLRKYNISCTIVQEAYEWLLYIGQDVCLHNNECIAYNIKPKKGEYIPVKFIDSMMMVLY